VTTFQLSTGEIRLNGVLLGTGYSGAEGFINDPGATGLVGQGPIPIGDWNIQGPVNSLETGPFSLPLVAASGTETFGRSLFLIHGGLAGEPVDSPTITPGGRRTASHGCLIAGPDIRHQIANDSDHLLRVVA
jgi:hypothetical protein